MSCSARRGLGETGLAQPVSWVQLNQEKCTTAVLLISVSLAFFDKMEKIDSPATPPVFAWRFVAADPTHGFGSYMCFAFFVWKHHERFLDSPRRVWPWDAPPRSAGKLPPASGADPASAGSRADGILVHSVFPRAAAPVLSPRPRLAADAWCMKDSGNG
jgi:hypothetical protein